MNVAQILESKGSEVFSLTKTATTMDAAQALATHRIGAIPVVEGARIIGIFSERDLVRAIAAGGHDNLDRPVTDLMTRNVTTCGRNTSIADVMAMMTQQRIRHLPIVEDGALLGIISIGDVVKERLNEAAQETEALKSYIASA